MEQHTVPPRKHRTVDKRAKHGRAKVLLYAQRKAAQPIHLQLTMQAGPCDSPSCANRRRVPPTEFLLGIQRTSRPGQWRGSAIRAIVPSD